jgi:cytosine deaminase
VGINAPRSISVHRKEIYDQIQRENRAAATLQPHDIPTLGSAQPPKQVQMKLVGADSIERQGHEPFILAAIEEARAGLAEGGLPIGSVLVRAGQIIGRGHNRRVQNGDPMAHAEIVAITSAGRQKTYRDTVIYSTLMPCYLCSGAAVQFGIPKVIAGESVNFAGAPDFLRSRSIEVVDLHDPECIKMMADFVRDHPDVWNEDIGKV